MSSELIFREPNKLFEIDEHTSIGVAKIMGGRKLRYQSPPGILFNKTGFIYEIERRIPGKTIRDGKKLFKVIKPVLERSTDTVEETIRGIAIDCSRAQPGHNPRGSNWHIDGMHSVLITDILATQVVVGELDEDFVDERAPTPFGTEYSVEFNKSVNRAIDRGDLDVHTLEPFTAYHLTGQVHRPQINPYNHSLGRSFMRLSF